MLSSLISTKVEDKHKVINIFGIKIKFKVSKFKILKLKKIRKYQYTAYLKEWFNYATGEELNLKNPKTFNEKIQWLKLYENNPLKTKLADKYLSREYVKEKIGEEYLIPLLGVYDNFDDIDFDKLPNKFVIKTNHGCGYNIIVKDKNNFDKVDAKKKINEWLKTNYAFLYGLELQYKDIKPKIIIEEFIENFDNELYDYKVWCFMGKAHYIQFLSERNVHLKMAFYDRDWNKQNFVYNHPLDDKNIEKPKNLDLLLNLAEKLAAGFPHVRVDFYILNDGTIKFGEFTFTSFSGICDWRPKETNLMLGNLVVLP